MSPRPPRLRLVRGGGDRGAAPTGRVEADLLALRAQWTRELREERGTRWLLQHRQMLAAQWAEMIAVGLLP